jgi:hypothetical protein
MICDYYVRLICLCFASFFLVHTAAGAAVLLLAPVAFRRAERMPAGCAAGLLFSLRLLPFVVAVCAVVGLCIPSYLWLEPRGAAEPLGLVCAAAAALGVLLCLLAGTRAIGALARTITFARGCLKSGRELHSDGQSAPVLIVDSNTPLLALSGVFRPRLFLSRAVFETLGPQELRAALRHEEAHRSSRDNWKRLALLLAPEIMPFSRRFAAMEREWGKYSEWAADDEAARGDSQCALWLASALVRVARMGTARPPELAAPLTACGRGLESRVERLLRRPAPAVEAPRPGLLVRHRELLLACAFTGAVILIPGTLACVHGLLEQLVR